MAVFSLTHTHVHPTTHYIIPWVNFLNSNWIISFSENISVAHQPLPLKAQTLWSPKQSLFTVSSLFFFLLITVPPLPHNQHKISNCSILGRYLELLLRAAHCTPLSGCYNEQETTKLPLIVLSFMEPRV